MRTNLTAVQIEDFVNKKYVFVEKILAFLPVFLDKGDCSDVWMIKITIKTSQIDMDVCFFQK